MEINVVIAISNREELYNEIKSCLSKERFDTPVELIMAFDRTHLSNIIADADVILCWSLPDDLFHRAKRLLWIAFATSGVDDALSETLKNSDVLLTKATGVADIAVAEHTLGLILMLFRNIHRSIRYQFEGTWGRGYVIEDLGEVGGSTIGILGLGFVGKRICRYLKALNARVLGCDKIKPEEDVIDEFYAVDRLDEFLEGLDCLVLAVPLTNETFHIINSEHISKMKEGAFLVNIARGSVVDELALIEALNSGHLGGVALDVFEREPLPKESPLYRHPNCIITPHIAGVTPFYWKRLANQFVENLGRFIRGEQLLNLVDKEKGF
ncbi:MAG: D-2-hydroxyacid dehydrogenase [bacterium]